MNIDYYKMLMKLIQHHSIGLKEVLSCFDSIECGEIVQMSTANEFMRQFQRENLRPRKYQKIERCRIKFNNVSKEEAKRMHIHPYERKTFFINIIRTFQRPKNSEDYKPISIKIKCTNTKTKKKGNNKQKFNFRSIFNALIYHVDTDSKLKLQQLMLTIK